jgi:F-box-like
VSKSSLDSLSLVEIISQRMSTSPKADSEYTPSYEELSRARHHVHENKKKIQGIDEAVRSLTKVMADEGALDTLDSSQTVKAQIKALERLRTQITADTELWMFILAPVHRVPAEILGEIFYYFLTPWDPLDGSRPWSGFDYAPWLLTRVCRRWRRITFGTPRLWTVVHMAYPMNLPLVIPSWIKHSGSLPFDVFLEFPSLLSQVQHPKFATVLQAIWSEFHRCRTMFVELSPSDYSRFDTFLNPWRQYSMPALTTLIVYSDQVQRIGQLYAPNLRNLVVQTKQWHTINLEPIWHALPSPSPFLTSLYLEKISTTVDDIVSFIGGSPGLVVCTVKFEDLTLMSATTTLVSLPFLKSLSLDWLESDQAVTTFLCTLHVPALTSLSLHGRRPFGSVIDFHDLLHRGRWGDMSALIFMTLRKLHVRGNAFVQFLHRHQQMTEVDLIGCWGLNDLTESLVPAGDRPYLFPLLQKLSLSLDGDVVFETLVDAIRSRVAPLSHDLDGSGVNRRRLDEFALLSRTEISNEHQEALRRCFPHFTHVNSHVVSFRSNVKRKSCESNDIILFLICMVY